MNKGIIIVIAIFAIFLLILGGVLAYQNWQADIAQRPPIAPSELTAEALSATEIKLTWKDNSNNELGLKLFRDGQPICDLPENCEEYIDKGLKPATNYEYEVIAYNLASESSSGLLVAKTKNPPIRVWIDRIGVADNGEDIYRELLDKHGEIVVGVVITDGKTSIQRRLPTSDYYELADNEVTNIGILAYSTDEVGEYLRVDFVGIESDGGLGEELLCKALDTAVKSSMGTLSSLILTMGGVDFTDTFKEIIGFEDDYLGEYQHEWASSDNWGIGQYENIQCAKGDGNIGLRLWFTVKCPIEYAGSSK